MSTVEALTEETVQVPMVLVNGARPPGEAQRTRVPGLRFKRVPSGALLAQVFGALLFLLGLAMFVTIVWGPWIAAAVTMSVIGTAMVVLGTMRESGNL
jgi:hypothetical protein